MALSAKQIPMLGLLITLVSACLFSVCNVIVKQSQDIDPFTIAVYRFLGIAMPAASIVIYRNENPLPKERRWHLLARSVMGASNLIIHFYGLKHMPMADVNMISAASPIWVVIFARLFLKEPLLVFDVCNIIVTLLGILFIIRPPFIFGYDPSFSVDGQYYLAGGIVFAGSVILQSNVYILLRMLKNIHFSVTLLVFGVVGVLESLVFAIFLGDLCFPSCGTERYSMIAIGLLSFLAQILLTVSLQLEEAGKVSIMRKSGDILFAFLFQIFLFNELPGLWSIVGALLVTAAVLVSSAKKIVDGLSPSHSLKTKYLKCFYTQPDIQNDNNHEDQRLQS